MIDDERFDDLMELVVHGFEIGGVAVLVLGALGAFVHAAVVARREACPRRTRPPGAAWAGRSCSGWSC